MGSTGTAKDGLRLQENVTCGKIGFLQPLEQRGNGHCANVGAILMLRGERYGQKACVLHVIDSDDSDLVRDMYSEGR